MKMMQNMEAKNETGLDKNKSACPLTSRNSEFFLIKENEINERNMMPNIPNHSLSIEKDDNIKLNKKRDVSSIPKNDNEYWLYPSPQQFYNSLIRKNKDIDKVDVDAVVSIHNDVNEESWKSILKYEHMHKKKCDKVTLQRFCGKFDDLSFKAKFRSIFSRLGKPFDRHDWYIDRCGEEVKYILDYYNDESINDDKNIYIDVRPAMRNLSTIWDRIRYPFYELYFKHIKKDKLFR
ncbi:cytochrome c heme lyase, putative [Plasmodium chabaudi chabaudi]|uniref:Holocytochrome c-type synthase n=1 Tax=Plasmodium chabaudi chabaudi TaxID=31271 RepID=A0A077TT94_PLACU|nr:cytochrome c heme lyase, putative [Plasmodium chabaudi chabaudi]SCM26530.1 cytochrome c heme lyase, putative [Plasmodium chabaudi chabaudi]VTZ71092.1 cytochrome c heme lyase, putative [Plasmodium chabaudi chabaudi]|eukprot:XP_016654981.1 cytochrome c heme lyase, putative [Plasmodium chabaudi chabaudi]